MTTFVDMYHPLIAGTEAFPVRVAAQAVDDQAARGWLLVDPDAVLPDPSTPYYTKEALLSQITGGAAPIGAALRAAFGALFVNVTKDAGDTSQVVARRLLFEDTAAAKGSLVNVNHHGVGTGNVDSPGQTYALDVHNFPGARSALVIHQYSQLNPAFLLDNCGNQPAIEINNTANASLAPGTDGTGQFLVFRDHGASMMEWNKDNLITATKTITIFNPQAAPLSVQTSGNFNALDITKAGTAGGIGLRVTNAGTGDGAQINQTGGGTALRVSAGTGAAGFWPQTVSGQDYGLQITTATNNGRALEITKTATGGGEALRIVNQGTARSISIRTSAATEVAAINADGEFEHLTAGKGLLLKSPDGTRYRVAVANGGTVSVVAAP